MMKRRVPWWIPLAVAFCVGVAGYADLVKPVSQEIQALDREMASLRTQETQAAQRLAADGRVAPVPLPVGASAFQALWPELAQRVGTYGFTVDLLSFAPGTTGIARTVTLTVRLEGPYLALDDTVRMVNALLPLWTWRTIQISNPESAGAVDIIATGVLPLAGAPVRTPTSGRPPLDRSDQGSVLPPPPPAPTGGRP